MWRDPIVEEVRRIREANSRRFNYDIEAMVRDLQVRQKTGGKKTVDRSKRPKAPLRQRLRAVRETAIGKSKRTKASRR